MPQPLPHPLVLAGLLAPVVLAAGYLYGLVAFHFDRSVRPATTTMAAALGVSFGVLATLSIGGLQQAPSPSLTLVAMGSLAVGVAPAVYLALRGHRRVAAVYGVGLLAPWTLLFGAYLVELVMGADHSPAATVAAFLAGAIPLAIASIVAMWTDPVPVPDPLAPPGRPGSHRPGSLSRAIIARTRFDGAGPGVVFGVGSGVLVALLVPGTSLPAAVAAIVGAVLGTELELRWLPPSIRPAAEAFHWIGRAEVEAFRSATGGPVPITRRGMERWLATAPDTDASRRFRVEVLAHVGRLDEARAAVDRMPEATPLDRFRRATGMADIAWKEGRPSPLAELTALAAETGPPGDPARLGAEGLLAWVTAQSRLADLDPTWPEPLAQFRAHLGAEASDLHATVMRRPVLTTALAVSMLGVLTTVAASVGLAGPIG